MSVSSSSANHTGLTGLVRPSTTTPGDGEGLAQVIGETTRDVAPEGVALALQEVEEEDDVARRERLAVGPGVVRAQVETDRAVPVREDGRVGEREPVVHRRTRAGTGEIERAVEEVLELVDVRDAAKRRAL